MAFVDTIDSLKNFISTEPDLSDYATKTDLSSKANISDLATIATSGSYNDLTNKPTIPDTSDFVTNTTFNTKLANSLEKSIKVEDTEEDDDYCVYPINPNIASLFLIAIEGDSIIRINNLDTEYNNYNGKENSDEDDDEEDITYITNTGSVVSILLTLYKDDEDEDEPSYVIQWPKSIKWKGGEAPEFSYKNLVTLTKFKHSSYWYGDSIVLNNNFPENLSYWGDNNLSYSITQLDSGSINYLNSAVGYNMQGMFQDFDQLTSLDASNWDTSEVKNMSAMFNRCSSLTSLDLSNWDVSNVRTMSSMFYGCSSLTSLDLSNWGASNVTNMSKMFRECSSLTSLDLSDLDTSTVFNMSNMFQDCSLLTSLDLSNFDTSKVTNMQSMFQDCSSLTSLDLSGWDTSRVSSSSYLFNNCDDLSYIILDSSTVKFTRSNDLNNTCKILVPTSALSTYTSHSAWSSRASQFDVIENYNITRSNGQVIVTPKS